MFSLAQIARRIRATPSGALFVFLAVAMLGAIIWRSDPAPRVPGSGYDSHRSGLEAVQPHAALIWREARAFRKLGRGDGPKRAALVPADVHLPAPAVETAEPRPFALPSIEFFACRSWHPRDPPCA